MSLLERSAAMARDIEALGVAQRLADQVEAVRTRRQAFSNVAERLAAVGGRAQALRARGVRLDADTSAAAGIRHFVNSWRADVAANPAVALGAGQDLSKPRMLDPATKLASALETAATSAWKAHARNRVPKVEDELLDILAKLPGQSEPVASFRDARRRALQLSENLPSTKEDYERFDVYAAECSRRWAALEALDLPSEVQRFIHDAGTPAGARLLLLTPPVLEWLQTHGMMEAYRVRAR